MVRAPCCEKMGLKRGPWSLEEDQILTSYIQKHGHGNWRALPKLAGLLRCGKSCRLRWINYLRPDIKRGNFTNEEEENIIKLHEMLGNRWSAIAAKLPGRTDNEIKNVWHTHLKKKLLKTNQTNSEAKKKVITKQRIKRSDSNSSTITQSESASACTTSSSDFSSVTVGEKIEVKSEDIESMEEETMPEIDESFWTEAALDETSTDMKSSSLNISNEIMPLHWAAKMAVEMGTGVPWIMCKEDDAPDPVINTCNGFYCDKFTPNRPYKPTMWTEAWSGWFTEFGGPTHKRPVQDLAFAVARFVTRGGSFVNYYMYHGGTNFGRTAGGPFVATSYDYDAPLDEYGLIRQPKYGHLKELHKAIKMCERALVSTDPIITSLGSSQQAHVYSTESGDCAAFLSNYDSKSPAKVLFNNMHYSLPPWSVSILPDCRNAVFNTAKIGVQTSQIQMLPTNTHMFSWESFDEDISSLDDSYSLSAPGLLEQINVTRDASDYLWYITSIDIGSSESFLRGGELPTLIVQSTGHAVHVFINGQLSGSTYGTREYRRFMHIGKVNLRAGTNRIALLSVAIGLPNVGVHYETWSTGILGPVALHGLNQGKWDLSRQRWTYQVGLKGEAMNLASPNSISSVEWMQSAIVVQRNQPLTWHKTNFDAPEGDEPLALDMEGMGKGQIWINGQSIGRYWTAFANGNCNDCNYEGSFRPEKCQLGCGQPTQRWYHVPRSWLKPTQNLLVIFEELGGDPSKISLVKRSVSSVCADVSEYHPNIKNWHIDSYGKSEEFRPPKVHLHCSPGQTISSIKFASFGTPLGTCGNYVQGACHSPTSYAILEKKCVGKPRCIVTVSNSNFGKDPCPRVMKRLSVEAVCAPATTN